MNKPVGLDPFYFPDRSILPCNFIFSNPLNNIENTIFNIHWFKSSSTDTFKCVTIEYEAINVPCPIGPRIINVSNLAAISSTFYSCLDTNVDSTHFKIVEFNRDNIIFKAISIVNSTPQNSIKAFKIIPRQISAIIRGDNDNWANSFFNWRMYNFNGSDHRLLTIE